jgi:hypothetical protein
MWPIPVQRLAPLADEKRFDGAGGFMRARSFSTSLHQMLGVSACFGGELRKPRFLIRCEVDFHFFKIGESWCQATDVALYLNRF